MTVRRKTFVALLGLGAIALVADRFTRSENTPPPTEPDGIVAQAPAAAQKAPQPSPAPAMPPLSQRIRKAAEQSPELSLRDVFHIPLAWAGPAKISPELIAPTARTPRFNETHRLSALILAGDSSGALIDGMMIKIGESIDGYKLVSVTNNVAVFESTSEHSLLRVEKNAVAAGGD